VSEERGIHPWVVEARERLRFAIVGAFLPDWEAQRDFVLRAEELGFDAYWLNDHPTRLIDCWSGLAALAMITKKMRLISLVSCVYYRSAMLLARQAADVDRLSGGRLVLGLGIGDDVQEFNQMQLPFPPTRERHEMLVETIEAVRGLWAGAPFTYQGKHVRLEEAKLSPMPVQQPHVPLLIGGGGPRFTLREVAKYADVANIGPHEWIGGDYEVEDVRRKYEALRGHCEAVGRPYEAILRTHWTPLLTLAPSVTALEAKRATTRIPDATLESRPLFATPDEAVRHYQSLIDAGAEYFLVTVTSKDVESVDLLVERVIPALEPR
jgi:alkanesulfonate monooxygenase SsuD/methylene tetrahydromethanopterin reductase-like flavin-dependent oxidoreductase (luciferase family)